jgi:hypothetical protein
MTNQEHHLPESPRGPCEAFLAELDLHVAAYQKQRSLPGHAAECADCEGRLLGLAPLLDRLRHQPRRPSALRDRRFFEQVLEGVVEDCESAPIGRLLNQGMEQVEAPPGLGWPLQEANGRSLAEALAQVPFPDHDQIEALSRRTQGEVRRVVLAGRERDRAVIRRVSRRALAAAAVVTVALVGVWNFGKSDGTRAAPRIVIIQVDGLPSAVAAQLPLPALSIR